LSICRCDPSRQLQRNPYALVAQAIAVARAARVTRRYVHSGMTMCVAGLSTGFDLWGSTWQQNMKQTPASAANNARISLHDEVDFTTGPPRIYEVLPDSK
jgi:hypothetical protein